MVELGEQHLEESREFKELITSRWVVAAILTALVFLTYYGFILMIGLSRETLARKIGEATTLGIPLAVTVIVVSFVLTLVYVGWANTIYDKKVASLARILGKK
ncbi:MAG: DUF485 domain-containing protein [Bacillota bacterium]